MFATIPCRLALRPGIVIDINSNRYQVYSIDINVHFHEIKQVRTAVQA